MNKSIKNDRFLRALKRQPVDRTPIWIMRQAGRYLPEYRSIRAKAGDFMSLCKNPDLASQVTLQPINRFALDAAIIFSDILTIPDAMGLGLHFIAGEGPRFARPVCTEKTIRDLAPTEAHTQLNYVMEAIRLTKKALEGQVPLIGFAGSPWTLACYMVEGGSSKQHLKVRGLLYQLPQLLHHLLTVLADSVIDYLNAQIEAGVDVVMLFDSWGGLLSTSTYREFSLAYMHRIISSLTKQRAGQYIPSILFTRGGGGWLEYMVETQCDALGLDWQTDLADARRRVRGCVALQGNMDPAALLASPQRIREKVRTILNAYGPYPGHIFNLGHGITPNVPPEHVQACVEAVHELSGL